jgi:D-sedoheptulose 7-phosphate isomerase
MNEILKHINQLRQGIELLNPEEIERVVSLLRLVRSWNGTVYLCGNGGSAALASHFCNDLMKIGKVKAVCLSDCFPVVSAYGNDNGWENMYLDQLRVVFNYERDCVIGISCSGNSENVVRALSWAFGQGGLIAALTGQETKSKICEIGNYPIVWARVPDMRVQEDLHSVACHAIARELVEE